MTLTPSAKGSFLAGVGLWCLFPNIAGTAWSDITQSSQRVRQEIDVCLGAFWKLRVTQYPQGKVRQALALLPS